MSTQPKPRCPGSGKSVETKGVYVCEHCGREIAAVGNAPHLSVASHLAGKSRYVPNTTPVAANTETTR